MLEESGKDNIAFELAKKAGTIKSYEAYIKKHRSGKFIATAQKKIEELRQNIRKTTKIKFKVDYVKFFNRSIGKPGPKIDRKYLQSFKQGESNYIFTEVRLLNKFYKIDHFDTQIYIEYKNNRTQSTFKTNVKNIQQRKDLSNFIYTTGMGWKETGKWRAGKYTVSIYMDKQRIGTGYFEVVQ